MSQIANKAGANHVEAGFVSNLTLLFRQTFFSRSPSAAGLATWYLALALLGVVPLVLLTPPLQVNDEQQHFFRAYQLSEGNFISVARGDTAGAELPSSLAEFADRFLGDHTFLPSAENFRTHHAPLSMSLAALSMPLDPERREFVEFVSAAFYSPLAYVPQVAGMLIARMFGAGPLLLLYAARLASGLASIFVVSTALRILPLGNMLALTAALLPMTVYLFASASPDASVISTAFLFTAVVLRARFRGRWTALDLLIACGAGAVFCSDKPVYAPLLAMALPAALNRRATVRMLATHAVLISVVVGVMALWMAFAFDATAPFREGTVNLGSERQGINASAQLSTIVANPGEFVRTLFRTVKVYGGNWGAAMIGLLGWSVIRLPRIMYWIARGAALACLTLPSAPAPRVRLIEAGWQVLLIAACSLLVLTSQYLVFTPVGAKIIEGVQGRYFLPLAPLAAVALNGTFPQLKIRWPTAAQVALPLLGTNIFLTFIVVIRYFSVL